MLLKYYDKKKRDLPWRRLATTTSDVNERIYNVWVSEIMLQQTQVATVIDYYNKWIRKWPTIKDLSEATVEEVNEMWSGLGYYSRGRRLLEGAQKVMKTFQGEMPKTSASLMKEIPGVGKYTAGAIASIALNESVGVVDGNVIRVLSRMQRIGAESSSSHVTDLMWDLANSIVDPDRPGDFNQAMMELGATVCTPKAPSCETCPLKSICKAYNRSTLHGEKSQKPLLPKSTEILEENNNECSSKYTDPLRLEDVEDVPSCNFCLSGDENWKPSLGVLNYPRKAKKNPPKQEKYAVSVISYKADGEKQFLLSKRPDKGLLANLWEFPMFPINSDMSQKKERQFLSQSISQRFPGCSCEVYRFIGEVVHVFSHIHHTYRIYSANCTQVKMDEAEVNLNWMTKDAFMKAAISTAVRKVWASYEKDSKNESKTGTKRKRVEDSGDKKQMKLDFMFSKKK